MKLIILGTGNAVVTECYNTCFVLEDGGKHFMVDGGGGSTLLAQLKHAGLKWADMRHVFITHKHIDHLLGIIWMMRLICQGKCRGQVEGEYTFYAHEEVIGLLEQLAKMLLTGKEVKQIGETLKLVTVEDGQTVTINDRAVTFFDIKSDKAKQFGFTMEMDNGEKLTCCGDEPCPPHIEHYVQGSKWLLHEAFCLFSQADIFKPYEKSHSTAKDACELAQRLGVKNVVLYHTEDKTIATRKEAYTAEGRQYFEGGIFVPDDLEVIEL